MLRERNKENRIVQRYKLPTEKTNEQQALRSGRCRYFPIHTKRRNRYYKGAKKRRNERDNVPVILCSRRSCKKIENKKGETDATMSLLHSVAMVL